MKRISFITFLILLMSNSMNGQVVYHSSHSIPIITGSSIMSEHGFLPGKKFPYYNTIDKYNFRGLRIRVEIFDDRKILNLKRIPCSGMQFTNTSEFVNPDCIYKVGQYFETLLKKSGAFIDSTSTDTLQVRMEGLDSRLIGFGFIRVHGLCQMKIKYHNVVTSYCSDMTDSDKNSPIRPTAFVSRLTATRIMTSASIREVIEQFFKDLKSRTVLKRD